MSRPVVAKPTDSSLDDLCQRLAAAADQTDRDNAWPAEQLALCGEYGVYRWFLSPEWGGFGWTDAEVLEGYRRLAASCLTTTFILTQRTGASRRIAASENEPTKHRWLPGLAEGKFFATVGISHLTTSRRHLAAPVLRAREQGDDFILDGYSPWVTGGVHADVVVMGATMDDGRQILVALPMDSPGVRAEQPLQLVGVSASHTGQVSLQNVRVGREHLLAGPIENVMSQGVGGRTGGLETSCLAIGLARSALDYLEREAPKRTELAAPAEALREEEEELREELFAVSAGSSPCTPGELRARANSLALRATQAALAAAKGTGFVVGHPTGRWCREALFFLVWSCPAPVMAANLCELAGLSFE